MTDVNLQKHLDYIKSEFAASKLIEIDSIVIKRDERQRKIINTAGLKESIETKGLLHPIVLRQTPQGMELVAGERRLEACRQLGWKLIEYKDKGDLTNEEAQLIELEENIKRQDLSWQERGSAIARIHALYSGVESDWTNAKTAERIGMSPQTVSDALITTSAIADGDTKVDGANTKNQALTIIRRKTDREIAAAIEDLGLTAPDVTSTIGDAGHSHTTVVPGVSSILALNFHDWAVQYKGPKFNFIHCDFPYGINLQKSEQGNIAQHETYDDSPKVFWDLIDTLALHQKQIVSDSASILFWFDMAQYTETFTALRELDFNIYPIPLIWHKSDNKGILSDPARRARHIYETAFYGHRGDMKSVQAVSDLYPCPVEKIEHMSLKPEPMLRNFFRMFVDKTTRMLDPTCGSGSALRAAESLDANFVLGLERDPEVAKNAQTELQLFRNKRALAKIIEAKA